MDTGLKKCNSLFIKKAVALLLCFITAGLMANQVASSFIEAEGKNFNNRVFTDAVRYEMWGMSSYVWDYQTFRQEYNEYLALLSRSVSIFGDGSEQAYKKRKDAIDSQQNNRYQKDKRNFINAASVNNMYFLAGMYSGAIEEVNVLYTEDRLENEGFIVSEYELECYINDNGAPEGYKVTVVPETVKDRLEGLTYDGIFYTDHIQTVVNEYDYDEISDTVKASYRPGYYAFRVNDDVLKKELYLNDSKESFFSDYNSFLQEYNALQNIIERDYPSGRFYIRDSYSSTYTNIADLSSDSDFEQIEKVFEHYGTYTYLSTDGDMYRDDGRAYGAWFYDNMRDALNPYLYYNETENVTVIYESSIPETNTQMTGTTSFTETATTVVVTVPETTEIHTTLVPTVPTTMRNKNAVVEKVISTDGYICYVAVDFTDENEECKFQNVKRNVFIATDIIKECLTVCGIGLFIIICAFIYLISKAGKRDDSENVYLCKGDGIYSEFRIIADVGFAVLAVLGAAVVTFSAVGSEYTGAALFVVDILTVVAFGFIADMVLYIVRHRRNRSLLQSFGIVKLISVTGKKLLTGYSILKNKLLYTKELQKTVFIRTAIVIGINIIVGAIAFITTMDNSPKAGLFIVFVLFLFDLYVIYKGMRFVGGVEKLFTVVKEMRNGNLDTQIDKNALPGYLYIPAENLQCLSEGMKEAVNEAVRQEKTKTELITNVSHDLKTPLTSIINYVDLLKKCEISDETAVSYLQVLSEKSDRLKVLIEDLVEASKASAGVIPVNFMSVSLKELMGQLVGEFEESFEEKNLKVISVMPEEDIFVKADSKLIYRVMENLFVNIKKYALENTRVYITVGEKGTRGFVTLKNISAAPLNITADELKERFVRGEQSRTTEGNGLGLSIAENLCTLQNGSLKIEINGDLFSVTVETEKVRL